MKSDIEDKLRVELSEKISDEPQVVYILSRVRKLLEIYEEKKKYKILKFFCDWALHAEIEDTDPIRDLLDRVIGGGYSKIEATTELMLNFSVLYEELEKFLKEHNISAPALQKFPQRRTFERLLSQIYSDTPLIVKTVAVEKKRLIWKGEYDRYGHGGKWEIEIENVNQP